MTYVNAGHNPPVLVKAGGDVSLLSVAANVPLGIVEGMTYEEGTLRLDGGDTLVLYTDGVTEATNRQKAFFTEKCFLEVLEGARRLSAQGIVEKNHWAVACFAAGASPADDITLC